MLYDAPLAQRFAERLLEEGIYAIGFFFPVVAKGQARIRTQMSAAHTREHLDRAIDAFTRIGGKELGVDVGRPVGRPYGDASSISAAVNSRHCPFGKSPSCNVPMATRTSRNTPMSSAASRRRICRLRPSSSTISSQAFFRRRAAGSPISPGAMRLAFDAIAHAAQFGVAGDAVDLHVVGLGPARSRDR